jgi:hypothetical protein
MSRAVSSSVGYERFATADGGLSQQASLDAAGARLRTTPLDESERRGSRGATWAPAMIIGATDAFLTIGLRTFSKTAAPGA